MYTLYFHQKLPIDIAAAWDFFSSPMNLQKITPEKLDFRITEYDSSKKMYPGQIIAYTVRPFWNINMEWVTQIVAVEEQKYFIDEQKFGPYTFWHHEHRFTPIEGGVLMEDRIYYKVPLGIFGRALHALKIKKDIDFIFEYRKEVLKQLFCTDKSGLKKHE